MQDIILINKYSDKILDIVENRDEFTHSDLQGAIQAQLLMLTREARQTIDFETRLAMSKEQDMF